MKDLKELEKKLNISFKNKSLLKNAFIHRSYLNEHPEERLGNNERLEFLGDSVLSFVVSEHLYERFPSHPEGDLTNFRASIVNARSLAKIGQELDLGEYLFLSRGEEATGGRSRTYLLANTYEALLGAIYLDQGIELSKRYVQKYLLPSLDEIISKRLYKDYKSHFQEMSQEGRGITPEYKILKEAGPDHEKEFTTGVYLGSRLISTGTGRSKQEAEQEAAKSAIANWESLG